jgi:hypothetical protein
LQLELIGFDLRHIEDGIDHAEQMLSGSHHYFQTLHLGRIEVTLQAQQCSATALMAGWRQDRMAG